MARAMARRTRTSSSGGRSLFIARIVSPSVEPTTTEKRGSVSNCTRFSGAGKFGNASTSPAIIAAKAAVGSGMKRNATFSSAGASPQ